MEQLEAASEIAAKDAKKGGALTQWQSGGRLGAGGKDEMAERARFADQWERMVTTLLYMPNAINKEATNQRGPHSTISFRTADYEHKPERGAKSRD